MVHADILSPVSLGEKNIVPDMICPSCGELVELDASTYFTFQGNTACKHCKTSFSIVVHEGRLSEICKVVDAFAPLRGTNRPEVPEFIRDDLREAAKCLSVEGFRACVVLCRRIVHAVLLDQGIKDQFLAKMIEDARNQGTLKQHEYERAIAIKLFGNTGAHPKDDELNLLNAISAQLALFITTEIVKAIYL